MTNEDVQMTHRHPEGEQPMRYLGDDRIDGLRLREYACECGYGAAVLTRVPEERQGASWPFAFRYAPPVS